MPSQGVLYIKWGTVADAVLNRSLLSLRTMHPDWPVHIAELPANSTLLDKSRMLDLSPFDQTLYLDADTVILDRLDQGFAKADQFSIACCIAEVPWARRFKGLADHGDLIEYNTGVLFFTKSAAPLFARWKEICATLDTSTRFWNGTEFKTMPLNDQGCFAKAIEDLALCPFVLPMNWNFRPLWQKFFFGPLKIWHDFAEVPSHVRQFSLDQTRPGAIIQGLQI